MMRIVVSISTVAVLALAVGSEAARGGQATGQASPAKPAREEAGPVTFVSRSLGVALDHPSDWTVSEQASGATFKSPQGVVIQLSPIPSTGSSAPPAGSDDPSLERLPNTRCSSTTNPHGVELRTCLDTISRSYTSEFVLGSEGSARRLSLWMAKRLDLRAFNAMTASVRPLP